MWWKKPTTQNILCESDIAEITTERQRNARYIANGVSVYLHNVSIYFMCEWDFVAKIFAYKDNK